MPRGFYRFARPSFLQGWSFALNLFGGFALFGWHLQEPERTDAEALAGDWKRVGDDLRNALERYEESVTAGVAE